MTLDEAMTVIRELDRRIDPGAREIDAALTVAHEVERLCAEIEAKAKTIADLTERLAAAERARDYNRAEALRLKHINERLEQAARAYLDAREANAMVDLRAALERALADAPREGDGEKQS